MTNIVPRTRNLVRQDETRWMVSGSASVDQLLEAVGRPELRAAAPSDISTVAGLVQAQLDRIAVAGDQTVWEGLSLEVVDIDGLRIDHVLVTVEPDSLKG